MDVLNLVDDMKRAALAGNRARADSLSDQISTLVMAHIVPSFLGDWDKYRFTKRERAVVEFLHSKLNKLVSKQTIHNAIYFDDPNGGPVTDIIEVFICRARKKLEKFDAPFHIETIFGQGFMMKAGAGERVLVNTSNGTRRGGYGDGHGRPKSTAKSIAA